MAAAGGSLQSRLCECQHSILDSGPLCFVIFLFRKGENNTVIFFP